MTYEDLNKQHRELQRRLLKTAGWVAVPAVKDNSSFQWKWIHPKLKKAYSREAAVALQKRRKLVS
jgi:hypothetical protein